MEPGKISARLSCVLRFFYLQSKSFSLILRKGRRGGNCEDWDLSKELNCGCCTLDPSSADHFSKLFEAGFKCTLFSLDPSMKTSIQQEECCLGPTHFHYKRHGGRVHPVSLHSGALVTKRSIREVKQRCTTAPRAPLVSHPPGCPAAQWLTALPVGQENAAVTSAVLSHG